MKFYQGADKETAINLTGTCWKVIKGSLLLTRIERPALALPIHWKPFPFSFLSRNKESKMKKTIKMYSAQANLIINVILLHWKVSANIGQGLFKTSHSCN